MCGGECLLCYGAVDREGNWVITLMPYAVLVVVSGSPIVLVLIAGGMEILAGVVPGMDEIWLAWIIAGVTGD